jgi:2-C-methyl-D-erythritol 4-phosphate cytidylyltransferase
VSIAGFNAIIWSSNHLRALQLFVFNQRVIAFIPAAGSGSRMGESRPKQYLPIASVPILFHTIHVLLQVKRIARLYVVLSPDDNLWETLWSAYVLQTGIDEARLQVLRVGGATRAASVSNALAAVRGETTDADWALVHDAARPCIRRELIEQFLDELIDDPVGGLLALPVADTLKFATEDLRVERTVSRENLWRAQTPQMFRYAPLCAALARSPTATDEASAMEAMGQRPKLVIGDSTNLKITYASDLKLAEMLLAVNKENGTTET